MNKRLQASILAFMTFALSIGAGRTNIEETISPQIEYVAESDIIHIVTPVIPKEVPKKMPVEKMVETTPKPKTVEIQGVVEKPEPEPEPEISMSKDDMKLIAQMTMAEAEGESEYGQRLVIDTILNRVDSSTFPDTVYDVLYQPYQFSSIKDGRFARCHVKKELYELVVEEVHNRTNYDVIFFRTGHYSKYGTPLFKEDSHYFNSL